jgi:hypothetical protein
MCLDGFYRGLAAMASDPDLVRRSRTGDVDWLLAFDLTSLELDRLGIMARDDRMEVICSLYRSNRVTALINTVPTVVKALGDRLPATVSEFWASTPRTDLQFRTEGASFCNFVSTRFPEDASLLGVVDAARATLVDLYDAAQTGPGR